MVIIDRLNPAAGLILPADALFLTKLLFKIKKRNFMLIVYKTETFVKNQKKVVFLRESIYNTDVICKKFQICG